MNSLTFKLVFVLSLLEVLTVSADARPKADLHSALSALQSVRAKREADGLFLFPPKIEDSAQEAFRKVRRSLSEMILRPKVEPPKGSLQKEDSMLVEPPK